MNNTLMTSDQNFKITLIFFTKKMLNIVKESYSLNIKSQLSWNLMYWNFWLVALSSAFKNLREISLIQNNFLL